MNHYHFHNKSLASTFAYTSTSPHFTLCILKLRKPNQQFFFLNDFLYVISFETILVIKFLKTMCCEFHFNMPLKYKGNNEQLIYLDSALPILIKFFLHFTYHQTPKTIIWITQWFQRLFNLTYQIITNI